MNITLYNSHLFHDFFDCAWIDSIEGKTINTPEKVLGLATGASVNNFVSVIKNSIFSKEEYTKFLSATLNKTIKEVSRIDDDIIFEQLLVDLENLYNYLRTLSECKDLQSLLKLLIPRPKPDNTFQYLELPKTKPRTVISDRGNKMIEEMDFFVDTMPEPFTIINKEIELDKKDQFNLIMSDLSNRSNITITYMNRLEKYANLRLFSMNYFKNKVKNFSQHSSIIKLISDNRIPECFDELEKSIDTNNIWALVATKSDYNFLQEKIAKGVISNGDMNLERRQIINRLLSLLDQNK